MAVRSLCAFAPLTALVTGVAFLMACTVDATSTKKKKTPIDPGDEFWGDEAPSEEQPIQPSYVEDSGAFGAGSRPSTSKPDAGPPPADAGPKVYCNGALVPGDLAVVEIMIASRGGSGDDGEWVEIQSTRDCWLKIQGVSVESPRGSAAPNVVTVETALELAPHGSFVVADTADPAKNHNVPGDVLSWGATDVLKNDGDTIDVRLGTTVLDSVTYPKFTNLEPGRSLSFPADCTYNHRPDWARWSLTFDEFATGYKGTPNGPNTDVACF